MRKFSEILYDIYEHLARYDELEIIDEDLIRSWALTALRKFGNLVTVDKNSTVLIHNYRGELPYYYYSLKKAKKCGVTEYEVKGNPPQYISQTLMKIREEVPIEQQANVEYLNPDGQYKKITETIYLNTPNTVKATVVKGAELELVTDINISEVCDVPEEDKSYEYRTTGNRIAIMEPTMKADFESGIVYIEYRGYPSTEDGELIIKDGGNGELYEYLFNYLMRKSFQYLWTKHGKDVVTRIQAYTVMEKGSLLPAMTALKAGGIAGGQYIPGIKRKNQSRFGKFNRF